ncbi:MAG TPA: hypothetical protein VGG16_25030 [Streptosporangiaceae bacterium]|jgi:hypothetical protein
MAYAAYLRIYEPVSAFHEPERSRWDAYAASSVRPRRRDALAAESSEAIKRLITAPSQAVPEEESRNAYVRRVDHVVYVCPWQTRLRSLLAAGALVTDDHPAARPHIRLSMWTVPLAWFVPFAGAERWIATGPGPVTTTRALLYATSMARARRRIARGLAMMRALRDPSREIKDLADLWNPGTETELADVGRWLERFHPHSLVELDYGGLVHLLSDDALWGDESVAEIAAAIDGIARGQGEVARAMYVRVRSRWRMFSEFEQVN